LIEIVYPELRQLAASYLRRERPEHTLQPTALVHEAYLRLAGQSMDLQNRSHFFGVAAHLMRQVLVQHARSRRALKRDAQKVPKRSAQDAIQKVHELLQAGNTDVVDADLSKYFDTIPHRELIQCVARRIVDRDMLHLIKMWLKVPVEERDGNGKPRVSGGKNSTCGTPQGGVISPLLANLYMNRFLKYWRITGRGEVFQAQIVNYADDFVILSRRCATEALNWTRSVMPRIVSR
jgi:DNA-directed RNA polymerase specialized sigma24 family protein